MSWSFGLSVSHRNPARIREPAPLRAPSPQRELASAAPRVKRKNASAQPPAKRRDLTHPNPSSEGTRPAPATVLQGTLTRARNPGSHQEIQRLVVPSTGQAYLLAPPYAHGGFGVVSYAMGPDGGRYAAKSVYTQRSLEQEWAGVSVTGGASARCEVAFSQGIEEAVDSVAAVDTNDKLVHVMQLMDGTWASMPTADSSPTGLTLSIEGFLRSARNLASFHRRGVLHGDIKVENLFWNQRGLVKWGDYGVSETVCEAYDVFGRRGTKFAMAPEVTCDYGFGLPADMWSYGVAMSEIFLGRHASPFRAGWHFSAVQDMQKSVVDDQGKLQVGRLMAGDSDLLRYFARWYAVCPGACRFALEELFLANPDHRATSARAGNVAKKLVGSLPNHAKLAKRGMAEQPVADPAREQAFKNLTEAWRSLS